MVLKILAPEIAKMIKDAVFETSTPEAACLKLVDFLCGVNVLDVIGSVEDAMKQTQNPVEAPEINEEDFKLFWLHFPRKVGRPEVELKYRIEVGKGAEPHEMLRALRRYRTFLNEQNIEAKFVKHGTTFLKDWRVWL